MCMQTLPPRLNRFRAKAALTFHADLAVHLTREENDCFLRVVPFASDRAFVGMLEAWLMVSSD